MAIRCPKCGSTRIVPVGQYDKFIYCSLGGTAVIGGAALLGLAGGYSPGLWFLIPFWLLGCVLFYVKYPLAGCDDCNHLWNPRKRR